MTATLQTQALAKSRAAKAIRLVRYETFIQAIRDSGYKSPSAAIAELVDNAIEANARNIHIEFITSRNEDSVSTIRITDDGSGMTPEILQTALQFGGSSRFNSRQSLGRYGMGLPCSALSIGTRVDVWTCQSPGVVWWSYLDVMQISDKGLDAVPRPKKVPFRSQGPRSTGTCVELSHCDRLDPAKRATLTKLLHSELGRVFRHLITRGITITLEGEAVAPIDPLFCFGEGNWVKGVPFGPPLKFRIRVPDSGSTSEVAVFFSELPIKQWFDLPNKLKRQLGIANGAGISVVRAGREVDYGWFFLGKKRRENYDDWWRCEIQYEPVLDELFGLTHTKQGIRPTQALAQIMSSEIEAIARTLNARVRGAFAGVKSDSRVSPSERRATRGDLLLDPPAVFINKLNGRSDSSNHQSQILAGLRYNLVSRPLKSGAFFEAKLRNNTVNVQLNTRHVFYEQLYQRIKKQKALRSCDALMLIEILMLAYSRAELSLSSQTASRHAAKLRFAWSNVLTSFLG
jgi:hypothetical protein